MNSGWEANQNSGLEKSMKTAITFPKFVLLTVLLIGCGRGRKPQEFRSEAGGFSVMVPVVLTEAMHQVESERKVDMHQLRGERGKTTYYVTYADHPEMERNERKGTLDYFCNGTVAAMNGRLAMQTNISLDGNPGRELVIEVKDSDGQDLTLKARLFLVKARLYEVMVLAPQGENGLAMDDFLRSFKLVGSREPAASPPQATVPSSPPQRTRVGAMVTQANLMRKVQPVYPPLARQARVQGTVHFTAIVGKDGAVQSLKLIDGHPLLVQAAQDAVKRGFTNRG
jgi:hypothetical protein